MYQSYNSKQSFLFVVVVTLKRHHAWKEEISRHSLPSAVFYSLFSQNMYSRGLFLL